MFPYRSLNEFKGRKIKHFLKKEVLEPQEVFLDKLAQKKEKELGAPERKIETPLSKKLLQGFLVFGLLILFFLFGKTFQLQVIKSRDFLVQAESNKFIISSIRADRGVIYDSRSKQLVFNMPSFDLILNKNKLPEAEEERKTVLSKVSEIIGKDELELESEIKKTEDILVPLLENIEHEKLIILETKISELQGFEIQRSAIREYQGKGLFSHIVGYTGKINSDELKQSPDVYSGFDYVGRTGIEKSYEDVLRKNPGKLRIERDAQGNQISREIISLPKSGNSLVLWLDSELQEKVESELKKTLERISGEKAVAVALNPKNGGVLALVSLPNFDNNIFNKDADPEELEKALKDEKESLFNRVLNGKYATGSTIKPIVAVAALEEEIISASEGIDCQGGITIPHRYDPEIIYEMKDWSVHGWTDVRKAIAESCNTFFYTIGGGYKNRSGLGPAKIKKYLELFGWSQKTGIDLPAESEGFVPSPEWKKENKKEGWWDGDTYNLSIGQGDIMITPIQVVASFAAIANGGTLYKPKVVKEIVDCERNLLEEIKPEIIRENFISPENLEIVREGMRKAVTGIGAAQASSVILNSLPVSAAAKTGTAQTSIPNHYHNWVSVFAPYDNPEIVLTIMFENVPDVQAAALPTAREILNWYFTR